MAPHTSSSFSSVSLSELEFQRLREILNRSEPLQAFIRANLDSKLSHKERSALIELLVALENEKNPAVWISQPNLIALLPVVIRFHDLPSLTSSDVRYLLVELMGYSNFRSRAWNSLIYPIFLTVLVFIFIVTIGLFITPVFGEMYKDFGLRVPVATEILLGFSRMLVMYPILGPLLTLVVLVAIFATIFGFVHLLRYLQHFSIVGYWLVGSRRNIEEMTKWLAVVTELLHIDVDLERALPIAAAASQSFQLEIVTNELTSELRQIRAGTKRVIDPAVVIGLPATVVNALFGTQPISPTLLRQIVTANHIRLEERQGSFGGLLGPITTLAIGFVVGFTILALFLPLLKLVSLLS